MTTASSENADTTDLGTTMQDPEHIYVCTVTNPQAGNQVITAHRTRAGAEAQVDELATTWGVEPATLEPTVLELPLLP
jgi:hypothetical protein